MANETKTKLRLEITHVLFIDIVSYWNLLIDDQQFGEYPREQRR
jgi:hypothetical protein